MKIAPILAIQGGAGKLSVLSRDRKIRKKLKQILSRAYEVLLETDAVTAVTEAVRLLENDTLFNAGTGSLLQEDGQARLSASVMDGQTERFAAVLNLERIKNPVLVAASLLNEDSRVLAGDGAFAYARSLGLKPCDTRTRASVTRWKKSRPADLFEKGRGFDTVGAVALDRRGNLASATSTGGRGLERPGRVSDSGMPVANFADASAAVSATGTGEEIIEEGLAIKIATRIRDKMSLKQAFQKTFREVREKNRRMGAIAVDTRGNVETATTTEVLLFAYQKNKSQVFY